MKIANVRQYSLILHGNAGLGKTPLAMTFLAQIATKEQDKMPFTPYFMKVGTMDSLRDAFRGHIKPGIPILFDDLTLIQGTSHDTIAVADLKQLFEVKESSGMRARFKDFTFFPNMPKIFTSSAMDLYEFHKGLPLNIWTMTTERRRTLQPNIHAAFTRACFAHVEHCLVPGEVQELHNKARRVGDC